MKKKHMVQFLSYSRYSSNASDQGSVLLITRGFSGKGNFVDFKFTRSQQSQKKEWLCRIIETANFFDLNINGNRIHNFVHLHQYERLLRTEKKNFDFRAYQITAISKQ